MLEVRAPGLLTTLQDAGRPAWAAWGVPGAGACDPWAAAVANRLVGNAPDAALLEITLVGPTLHVLATCAIGLAGADLGARVDGEQALAPGSSYLLRAGSVLTFAGQRAGLRAYLALAGGIQAPLVLGARATYGPGGFGGLDGTGQPLRVGDRLLPATPPVAPPMTLAGRVWPGHPADPVYSPTPLLWALPGPHTSLFAPDAWAQLCTMAWTVSAHSDRMGLRLQGLALARSAAGAGELLSQGIPWGAIQVPPDGQPIVLLADHQTVGGYPVIGVVARASWPLLAQAAPGSTLHFHPCTIPEAQAAYRAQAAVLEAGGWGLESGDEWSRISDGSL